MMFSLCDLSENSTLYTLIIKSQIMSFHLYQIILHVLKFLKNKFIIMRLLKYRDRTDHMKLKILRLILYNLDVEYNC